MTRLRAEDGVTLVELLIAMVVMAIGTAAILAGFNSGIFTVNRARVASTAGALADKQMETYRQIPATLPAVGAPASPSSLPGPDGQTYWMKTDVAWSCAVGTYSAGPPPTCSGTPANRPVKLVTITMTDGPAAAAKVLFSENATFDSATG